MSIFRKILLSLLLVILPGLIIPYLRPQKKQAFSLEAISAQIPFHSEWQGRLLSKDEEEHVARALSQPYKYLGSGGQCFSFVSSDEKYVIKFFKQKAFALPIWMNDFPFPFLIKWLQEKKTIKRKEKRHRVFNAFGLSFDFLPSETGLLYVHLNRTIHLKKTLSFCDAMGKTHLLNLDKLEFVIQKKADLAYSVLDSLMEKGNFEGAKLAIDQLLLLNIKLYQKGFRNRDPNFRSNCGFIDGQAIVIDVGRIIESKEIKEPKNYQKELSQIIPKFRLYLSKRHPELLSHFDQTIEMLNHSEKLKI